MKKADKDNILNVSIVHLADIICHKAGMGSCKNAPVPSFQEAATKTLQINEEDIDPMAEELKSEEEKVQAFISEIT